mmetsp:Transcript_7891/g.15793  ORF Transcript_7891/g.15793 Transcript_7891/m.15793 type:complete len:223 (-) Transcript_7891:8-676(-)
MALSAAANSAGDSKYGRRESLRNRLARLPSRNMRLKTCDCSWFVLSCSRSFEAEKETAASEKSVFWRVFLMFFWRISSIRHDTLASRHSTSSSVPSSTERRCGTALTTPALSNASSQLGILTASSTVAIDIQSASWPGSCLSLASLRLNSTAAPRHLVKRVLATSDSHTRAPSQLRADCTWSSAALKASICDGFAPSRGRAAFDSALLSRAKLLIFTQKARH